MEEPALPREPPVADWKRERDVFNLYAAFHDIPRIENLGPSPDTDVLPIDFVPRPASDASLAAFAQLAALRLNAQRSMISLIDSQYQYILAEATPKTSLRFNSPLNQNSDILMGNVRIPRNWGLCERVLDTVALEEGDPGIIIIKDLRLSPQHANRFYVKEGPEFRFYAGVPIKSLNGTTVGSMCIYDGPERTGMSAEEILYLKDLAVTVMEYLVTYTLKDQHRRAAEGLHGLLSFAGGDLDLQQADEHPDPPESPTTTKHMSTYSDDDESLEESHEKAFSQLEPTQPGLSADLSKITKVQRGSSSISDLQQGVLPSSTLELFAKAASIMRTSRDMDGVMFWDAAVAATAPTGNRSPTQASGKRCQILGFATQDKSSVNNDSMPIEMTPDESNLTWLLKKYPSGYSLDCDDARPFPSGDDPNISSQQGAKHDHAQHVMRVKALFPNIRSALFMPFWDFERNRWFAGCFCWSTRAERNLSGPFELPFLRAFGHLRLANFYVYFFAYCLLISDALAAELVMQEVARLEAMNTNEVKTTFLSSLSHELRSPLHGILGSIQLMRNTNLDSFQASMINSIHICGRTLFETVQHLLDHAERKDSHNYSTKTFPAENTVRVTAEPPVVAQPRSAISTNQFCNVGLITEEVVETMFLGQARFDISLGGEDAPGVPHSQSSSSCAVARRRGRFIMVDIADYANLDFSIAASSYGRIVMNLLGNALKFTEAGYILVQVRAEAAQGSEVPVTLDICDSGIGISKDFLYNDLFEPFRKRNQHSAGTGVGLSVVRRIIEDIGGSIEIRSEPEKGTEITVKLALQRFNRPASPDSVHGSIAAALSDLKGRKICLLHSKSPDADGPPEHMREWEVLKRYVSALNTTLENELRMDVVLTSDWDPEAHEGSDIVILPEVSFESLQTIRSSTLRRPPAILFIAMDTMEADTLRCDARVTSDDSVVEVVTQPCGPYKLGMVLSKCLDRYDRTTKEPMKDSDPSATLTANVNGSQHVSEMAPKLGLHFPLPYRTKSTEPTERTPPLDTHENEPLHNSQSPAPKQVLIVDDNAINRRLLSAFLKKRKLAFKEAKDGLQGLEAYRKADGKFDTILMDISMPVMDGMTSTRLIREHENEHNFTPTHIIALTGLTSASAKLEAWTSGVDDFMTKPVDFTQLERLMKAGRGESGTGFLKEDDRK
ncbi:hypothetical protein EJ02DRAFT_466031 [Clathrospora elynae]|uniref:Sensor histidine kinase-like protein/response regulator n=1 Tax=Clathrospora elynae TaxID=706981 RepID=A0A6A5SNJ7_9PLEO|nr:hypothetical protein EJ02DRAFT_466031 [Clathrospora elynae]